MGQSIKLDVTDNIHQDPNGREFKGQKQLIREYWLGKKTEAINSGSAYTEEDKLVDISIAKSLYPIDGVYVIIDGKAKLQEKM